MGGGNTGVFLRFLKVSEGAAETRSWKENNVISSISQNFERGGLK